jgi:thiamine-phosphate pyrophosphorylase
MHYHFTPGAERAIHAASGWCSRNDCNDLHLPELLAGLLDESECRAARMLNERGVDLAAIRQKWAELTQTVAGDVAKSFSPAVESAFRAAERRLWDYPQPLQLATEHILLGVLAGESDVASWLRAYGLEVDTLEQEIHRLAGHERGPIDLPDTQAVVPAPIAPGSAKISPRRATPGKIEIGTADVTRILDAAANRAAEGLRVVEDYVRFSLDDRHFTAQLKALRHDLTAALLVFPTGDRLVARESLADVGADTKTPAELHRSDVQSVLTANFQRMQQALRSLEEFAKLTNPAAAQQLERLRYRAYTLERAVDITRSSLDRLANSRLYVLLDSRKTEDEFRSVVKSLIAGGTHIIQLRDKSLDDRALLTRARILRELTRGTETFFIMNDRPDLALLANADGIHVGQEELCVKDVRRVVGSRQLIGVSTHNIEQAQQAVLDGANYIGVGPTFPSNTKEFSEFPGLDFIRAVSEQIRLPAFAIGGITLQNVEEVRRAGGMRIAVSAAVCNAPDVCKAASDFVACLPPSNS